MIFFLAHIFGCGFHYIGYESILYGQTNTWLNSRGIQDADNSTKYLESIYFALVTAITVGYGDITP